MMDVWFALCQTCVQRADLNRRRPELHNRITHTHKYTVIQQFMTFLSPFSLFFFRPSCADVLTERTAHIFGQKNSPFLHTDVACAETDTGVLPCL